MSLQKYITKLQSSQLLAQRQIKNLCDTAKQILLQQGTVIETSAPQTIIGDLHGQFYDLLKLLEEVAPKMGQSNYIFLGDYVDRGYNSIQTICLLLCYKCLYPNKVILIRGNHQTQSLTRMYGFYEQVQRKYGNHNIWNHITQVFKYLPLAAVISQQYICIHGGLSPKLPTVDAFLELDRIREIPEVGPMCDIVWSDPDNTIQGWATSNRGAGYLFSVNIAQQFLHLNDLSTIVRAHQLVEKGHNYPFDNKTLVTVWSAPNYCYRCGNQASVMQVDENGETEFVKFTESDQTAQKKIHYDFVLPYFL